MFSSSFCNGSSIVLLEISIELQKYPNIMYSIQKIGHEINQKIIKDVQEYVEKL